MLRQYNFLNNEIGELNRSVEKYMEIYKNPKKDYPLFVYSLPKLGKQHENVKKKDMRLVN